jgi:hypothetical protein
VEHNGTDDENALSPRQLLALPYLAHAPSIAEGARLANVGRSTLYRWLDDAGFRDQLERMRDGAVSLAHAELQGLMLRSVNVLGEILDSDNPVLRVRAARTILQAAAKAEENREIKQRIKILDDALALLKRQS